MTRLIRGITMLLAGLVLLALWYGSPKPAAPQATSVVSDAAPVTTTASAPAAAGLPPWLPAEALSTLALIERGGPYPHQQDGSVFNNYEGRLPAQPRGYYREFTVRTPGLDHRGARRIVSGGTPPHEAWYTDDHYQSFRRIEGWP